MEIEKLYSPLNFFLRDSDAAAEGQYDDINYWRDPLTHEEAFAYKDAIDLAILRDMESIDRERGLAEFVPESLEDIILSLHPAIELHGDSLWCVANITLDRPITPGEMAELTQWWSGQLSDGWGEGFEQREIRVGAGELYVEPWTSDDSFSILTQKEFDRQMGYTVDCRNGELRPGDLVLSTADDDYSCLVGTVLSIEKVGTPEHDTENETDDIHVNFNADYSGERLYEIAQMLGDMYGRPTTPGILPPVDVDDVIMAPEMLFRITGIGREELAAILDSGENAAAYAEKLEAALHETPAQAALHEPDIYDDEATAALREQLIHRLDDNLGSYFDTLRAHDDDWDITSMSSEIASVAGAHYYLTEIHNFHKSELEYLMRFQNPLQVVANKFEVSGIDDRSDIMWDIFDRQDALQGDYPLMPDPSGEEALQQELFDRLDRNLAHNLSHLHERISDSGLSKDEVFRTAQSIVANYNAHDYLTKGYEFRPGDIESLLRFQNPLNGIAEEWPVGTGLVVVMDAVVHDVLDGWNGLEVRPISNDAPILSEEAQEAGAEKPSVLEQIRRAREGAKDNPTPRKDTHGKDRGPEL